jgi:hypothetical protein
MKNQTKHHYININGVNIFYREAALKMRQY